MHTTHYSASSSPASSSLSRSLYLYVELLHSTISFDTNVPSQQDDRLNEKYETVLQRGLKTLQSKRRLRINYTSLLKHDQPCNALFVAIRASHSGVKSPKRGKLSKNVSTIVIMILCVLLYKINCIHGEIYTM